MTDINLLYQIHFPVVKAFFHCCRHSAKPRNYFILPPLHCHGQEISVKASKSKSFVIGSWKILHDKFLQENLNNSIESCKQSYYCRIANKLNNSQKNSRSYWSLIKIILNNKKLPLIPPFYNENCFITDFKEKAKLFYSFAKSCV